VRRRRRRRRAPAPPNLLLTPSRALSLSHTHRYPLIIQDCIETAATTVDGTTIPVDTSMPNPNGVEFDNLYLVRMERETPLPPLFQSLSRSFTSILSLTPFPSHNNRT